MRKRERGSGNEEAKLEMTPIKALTPAKDLD